MWGPLDLYQIMYDNDYDGPHLHASEPPGVQGVWTIVGLVQVADRPAIQVDAETLAHVDAAVVPDEV